MKISLDWLSDYMQIDRPAEEIAEILSNLGFPTEGIEHLESDTVIDLEVTSNRGDCLSHIGIARELAAATGRKLNLPDIKLPESQNNAYDFVDVEITEPRLCNRYTARIISGVQVGPTPEWMKKRLDAIGLRSVNNVVDATNYAMMETGQPPHAFDYDKLSGGKIIVRPAVLGEQLVSIDETKCDLNSRMLIIADDNKPVAIAGVMGGLETEISDYTVTIMLEDAHFEPVSVRTTGRRLGITSEALFRFERLIDTELVDWASRRAAQLITQVAGGTVAKGVVDAYPVKAETQTVAMRISRLNKLFGIQVAKDRIMQILTGLGFNPQAKKDDLLVCTVPTWRHDIYREVDLIEEVARSHGYDNIPAERKIYIEVAPVDKHQKLASKIHTFLNGCGFYETINVTFVDSDIAGLFSPADSSVSVRDESGKSANLLRRNLIGSLLGVLRSNYNAKNIPCRIYELANTFKPQDKSQNTLPIENTRLALVCDSDFAHLRGVIESLVKVVNADAKLDLTPDELAWADAGAEIVIDGRLIGTAGVISDKVAEKFDLEDITVSAAELDFKLLLEIHGQIPTAKPIPKFPAVTRDLSLIVDENIRWADITEALNVKAPPQLEDILFNGIYRGKPVPAGRKSVTISLRFRDEDGTLTHNVVDRFEKAILDELTTRLNAQLRTV